MALLTAAQLRSVKARWMSSISARFEACSALKSEVDAAFAATDTFIENNAVAYNLSLPLAARSKLTAAQKAEIFALVAKERFGG